MGKTEITKAAKTKLLGERNFQKQGIERASWASKELRLNDREFHDRYLRMSKERFDHVYSLVEAEI